jgi:hypothetical protein
MSTDPTIAYKTQYRTEFIEGFENGETLFRKMVTTEAQISGNTAKFLVADSGGASAVTRSASGIIPARSDNLNVNTLTLEEWHDLVLKTDFNLFSSQGDGRRIARMSGMKVLNRKIDSSIITALETGTNDTGASQIMTVSLAASALAMLCNNDVPLDGNIFGAMTPSAYAYLTQAGQFTSKDYVSDNKFEAIGRQKMFHWQNINWVVSTALSGLGTNAEKCIIWHYNAIGHALDKEALQPVIGYNEEQAYFFSRISATMGSKLLQNNGVLIINHDGSAHAVQ